MEQLFSTMIDLVDGNSSRLKIVLTVVQRRMIVIEQSANTKGNRQIFSIEAGRQKSNPDDQPRGIHSKALCNEWNQHLGERKNTASIFRGFNALEDCRHAL